VNGAIYNNLIYDSASVGITLHENAEGTIVAANTVDDSGRAGMNVSGELTHGSKNCIFTGNVVTNTKRRSPAGGLEQQGYAFNGWYQSTVGVWADYATANNSVLKNLEYGNQGTSNNGYHSNDTGDIPSGTITFGTVTHADPQYTNRTTRDYHLPSTSPAADIGDDAYTPTTDLDGVTRVNADAGAYTVPAGGSGLGWHGRGTV
jgi:hypothetical protein